MTDETMPMCTITQNDLDAHKAYAEERAKSGRTDAGKRLKVPAGHRVVLAEGVTLKGADLRYADLARADLAGADLADADLAGANLAGANLARAYLAGAENVPPGTPECAPRPKLDVPVIAHIDAVILAAIEGPSAEGKLDMAAWQTCETTHCRAGWAVVKAGVAGRELEAKVGTQRAATLIYRASRPDKPAPHWFARNERALEDIRACAAEDPLPAETK